MNFVPNRRPRPSAADLGALQILVVDDQPAAIALIKAMLLGLGAPPAVTVNDPRKALQLLRSSDVLFDVVLCDWRMPEMSGLDLLKQVRILRPELPFLMVTGAADAASVLAAKAHGASGYICKPFSADELGRKLAVIARIAAHRR
jgi:CheY-like chemotaxis protein